MNKNLYKICVYIPEESCEIVKQAMFAAGGGRIGSYDCCAWQTSGEGQFRPLAGSSPHTGKSEQINKAIEYQVEMVCSDEYIEAVIVAMKKTHPYQTPAYSFWPINR